VKPRYEQIDQGGLSLCCHQRLSRCFEFGWHFHPELELTYIVRGSGQRFVGDSISPYRDGDLTLMGANLPHTWASVPPQGKRMHEALYAQFRDTFLGVEFLTRPETHGIARLFKRAALGLCVSGRTRTEIGQRMRPLREATGLEGICRLLEILNILSRSNELKPLASKGYVPLLRTTEVKRIDEVCRFINENHARSLGQLEAAAVAHLSASAFSRYFRRHMGKSFKTYLNEVRVGNACRMLSESERKVTEIAFSVGFGNLSNFNRRFVQIKRLCPREYRRRFETA